MALKGLKVIELAGLAPAPFCGAILADFGAKVIRVDKMGSPLDLDVMSHGKKSIALNLKNSSGVSILRQLSKQSDVIIEPFRKGVMEKLGLGPNVLMNDNPRLIYARLTGYGQSGSMSDRAGHDINYAAISGLLSMLGRANEPPTPPINLLADFAGGGLTCALGIVMALYEREKSGLGQIVDSSMVEGAAYVGSWLFRGANLPIWERERGQNLLDTGSPHYDTYRTKDGQCMAVGALEPQFYALLLEGLGLSPDEWPQTTANEPEAKLTRQKFAERFASKTREEWTKIFEHTDACVTPILSLKEAAALPHNKERQSFCTDQDGVVLPQPAPKLSRSPGTSVAVTQPRPNLGQHTREVLRELGFSDEEINELETKQAISVCKEKSKL